MANNDASVVVIVQPPLPKGRTAEMAIVIMHTDHYPMAIGGTKLFRIKQQPFLCLPAVGEQATNFPKTEEVVRTQMDFSVLAQAAAVLSMGMT